MFFLIFYEQSIHYLVLRLHIGSGKQKSIHDSNLTFLCCVGQQRFARELLTTIETEGKISSATHTRKTSKIAFLCFPALLTFLVIVSNNSALLMALRLSSKVISKLQLQRRQLSFAVKYAAFGDPHAVLKFDESIFLLISNSIYIFLYYFL
jgi:hypothetical protein